MLSILYGITNSRRASPKDNWKLRLSQTIESITEGKFIWPNRTHGAYSVTTVLLVQLSRAFPSLYVQRCHSITLSPDTVLKFMALLGNH